MAIEKTGQQFTDEMAAFERKRWDMLDKILPPPLVDAAKRAHAETRRFLNIQPKDIAVIYGEQAYPMGALPKNAAKRVAATALNTHHGVKGVELFANWDVVGSEADIVRIRLPHPQAKGGTLPINILTGWNAGKNRPTAMFPAPKGVVLDDMKKRIEPIYGTNVEELKPLLDVYADAEAKGLDYAEASMGALRKLEQEIGIAVGVMARENTLDTHIVQNGGMEVILKLWPMMVVAARNHPVEGVRVPDINEPPFNLYHTDDPNCGGRMRSEFEDKTGPHDLNSKINSQCLHCKATEQTTPGDVLQSGRPITLRAIPRVLMYSIIFDGHWTGGGSRYNEVGEKAAADAGLPYSPLAFFTPKDDVGNDTTFFRYESTSKWMKVPDGPNKKAAELLVAEGGAAMADLYLSIGSDRLKNAIDQALARGDISTTSSIVLPPPFKRSSKNP